MGILQESFSILNLLPQNHKSLLKGRKQKFDILKLMIQVNMISIEAIEAFIQKEYHKFDAQVGENLCQIRAYKILLLSVEKTFPKKNIILFLNNLKLLKKRLGNLAHLFVTKLNGSAEYDRALDKKETIEGFFIKNNLIFDLSRDFLFVIISFFLCRFSLREMDIPIAINYFKIIEELKVAKYTAKKIVHHYQTFLAGLGCDFIFQLVESVGFRDYEKKIFYDLLELSDEDRHVLPCHEVTKIILQHMIKTDIYVLVNIDLKGSCLVKYRAVNFLFRGSDNLKCFALFDCDRRYLENIPVIVVRGESECFIDSEEQLFHFLKTFMENGLLSILLGNTAMHPQYSGNRLRTKKDNPFEEILISNKDSSKYANKRELLQIKHLETHFLSNKKYALSVGCCKENQELFFLKHIYCASYKYCETNFLRFEDIVFVNDLMIFESLRKHAIL